MKLISVVIPVYQSYHSLPILVPGVIQVLEGAGYLPQVILVDDCSPDDATWEVCQELKSCFPSKLKIVRLLTNKGQHNSTLCGLSLAGGEIVITMDDDLQNPPSEILKLIEKIEQGHDLAIAAYSRNGQGLWRHAGGGGIDWVLRSMFKLPPSFQLTSFRAMRSSIVREVCGMGQVFPYVTAMLLSHSTRPGSVEVAHEARKFGQSNYTLKNSILLSVNLIFSYSSYPLVAVALLCGMALLFSFISGAIVLFMAVTRGTSVPGWASLMTVTSFFNGTTMLCLLIYGVYLMRLNQQVSKTKIKYTISEIHE